MQQRDARRPRRRGFGARGRGTHNLAVRLVAQIEPIGAVTASVRERKRPDGDRERIERRRSAVAGGFAGEHASHVRLERHRFDPITAAGEREADADFFAVDNRCCNDHDDRRHDRALHSVNPRNGSTSLQILGRLAIS